ncbi:hypothetical protein H310_11662 [Aphanomyces invadans]|uniref:ABC transporter domain-containing protein n=1 Tax=Aphanomyces invadans TaxID=157072 RepID=A0A024TMT6_9STRA|nr:hypothetical protein H310_11662 [Aphanomyces invadans]ETV94682.1 hypothetical protein H310_11662 [Aphanomyces invadans]|eukprot:XP_008876627.1 hypothetical protein H310_11662 [Aphanomyces invadans]
MESPHFSPCATPDTYIRKNECTLGWDSLSYTVTRRGQDPKVILSKVSGRAAPGELVAIMGPSGSGKTTLLDILADRISTGQVTGQIHLNGRPRLAKTFRLLSSYVSQEDALTGSFTVLETLRFAARLSVPANVLTDERESRVQAAIDDMGLRSCEHTVVGDIFRKGLSGGQKRRLSIAIELLPSILLLDEPTSGLDAASTYNVMAYIQKLCLAHNHTVICTIHQPSTKVYNMFAKVMLLAGGDSIYFGTTTDMLPHFAAIGHPCPTYSNPAEYYLALVNTDFPGHGDIHALAAGYATSALAAQTKTQLMADRSRADFPSLSKADLREIKPSVGRQFVMLLQRTALENVRNPGIFWIRFVMFLVLSAMTGTLYLNDDKKLTDMDYVALLFGAPAFTTFLSVAALPFFLEQRAVFARERANSGLNVGAFTIATFVAALPGLALLAITATLMVVPMTGLHGFGTFFWIMFLSLTVAESLMSVLGVLVSNAIMGIALGAAALGMFMLTEGFMVPRPSIQHYWLWGHYLGFHTYSFEALVANQFQGVNTVGAKAVLARFDVADVHVSSHASILIGYALILQVIVGSLLYKLHTGRR